MDRPGLWIFDRSNSETIVLAIIGVLVPALFQIYMHYLLQRRGRVDREKQNEIAGFLKDLRKKHALEQIESRNKKR